MSKTVTIIYDPQPGAGLAISGARAGDELIVPEKLAAKLIAAGSATKKTKKKKVEAAPEAEAVPTVDAAGDPPAEQE